MRNKFSYGYKEPEPILGCRYLEVGDGHFAYVDDADYDSVKIYRWALDRKGEPKTQLPDGEGGFRVIRLKSMLLHYQAKRGMCIKYLDGNALNNSRSNLKIMTLTEARALDKRVLGPQPPRKWSVKNSVRTLREDPKERRVKSAVPKRRFSFF